MRRAPQKARYAGCVFTFLILCLVPCLASQPGELADPAIRQNKSQDLARRFFEKKHAAVEIARRQGFESRRQIGHTVFELMRIENDKVYEYKTRNANAAISVACNELYAAPYNLSGTGGLLGLWDGGSVLSTHQEYAGRVNIIESVAVNYHATHVAGTLIAAGLVASAKGMSPAAMLDSYEFNNDLSEMTTRAMSVPGQANSLQLSNHSYGYITGWESSYNPPRWYGTWSGTGPTFESDMFGQYDAESSDWDDLCYSAPYYLPFKAAGNDRSDAAPGTGSQFEYWYLGTWRKENYDPSIHPQADGWDQGGYDTISITDTAKNIMTVGAVNDAVSGTQRSLANATMAYFSCWGPTDDGRIKPDIVANGFGLYSSYSTSSTSYASLNGTSMATPNACGAAELILQQYGNLFAGAYMRASTLKALILHTADDLGNAGPDYRFGFGLMNTKAAVDLIAEAHDRPSRDIICESTLTNSTVTRTHQIFYNGTGAIKATICWTDPPGPARTGIDNPARVLVNDLDIRVVSPDGTITWMPYILDPASPTAPALTGDNTRDNAEQILIASPPQAGTYLLNVGFKGSLTNGIQHYSLIISGQSIVPTSPQAFDVAAQTQIDTQIEIELNAVDDGLPGGSLNYTILSLPNHGELIDLYSDPMAAPITAVPYTLANNGSKIFYNPRPGCTADAKFLYSADDGGIAPEGGSSNTATVTVTVNRPQTVYSANMDTNPGWSLQGDWQWGTPQGAGGAYGNPDPASAFTGTAVLGYKLSGDYANRMDQTWWATSPAIDCSGITQTSLSFYRWLNVDQWANDKVFIEISNDAANWTTLWQNSAAVTDSSWTMQTFDISAVADHSSTVYIRFGLGPTNNNRAYSGWNIDDVAVSGIADPLAAIPGDFEPDCDVDADDLMRLVSYWLAACPDCGVDLTSDSLVNLEDLSILAQNWLTEP